MSELAKGSIKDSYFVLAMVSVIVTVLADSLLLGASVLAAATLVFVAVIWLRARRSQIRLGEGRARHSPPRL
jgi:Flp pilus assembly protein TadB